MAVTIDEMNVDVQGSGGKAPASSEAPAVKEPVNYRHERELLAERDLRLKAD